jgi:hypothetical protein
MCGLEKIRQREQSRVSQRVDAGAGQHRQRSQARKAPPVATVCEQ